MLSFTVFSFYAKVKTELTRIDFLIVTFLDFSDSIAKERHGGYELGQKEYELLSCTTNETPLQRPVFSYFLEVKSLKFSPLLLHKPH